jgi:hypothetical protein
MEHDTNGMIEAARRMARRLARSTGTPYQTCLDDVARQLGRRHWSDFTAAPVSVPRATAREEATRTGRLVDHGGGVAFPPRLVEALAGLVMESGFTDGARTH